MYKNTESCRVQTKRQPGISRSPIDAEFEWSFFLACAFSNRARLILSSADILDPPCEAAPNAAARAGTRKRRIRTRSICRDR